MRQISIIAIVLTLFAASPLYALQAEAKVCASGQICPWQNETHHYPPGYGAGRSGLTCASGNVPCCRLQPVRDRDNAVVLASSVSVFRQAPAVAGSLELPRRRQPARVPASLLSTIPKEIPLYLKTLTLLC